MRVESTGNGVRPGHNEDNVQMIVTVADSQTGKPVINLAKSNFTVTFSVLGNVPACVVAPIIKTVENPVAGVYRLNVGYNNAACMGWYKGMYPVALQVSSTFNPLNPYSPGSYQGQIATLVEVR